MPIDGWKMQKISVGDGLCVPNHFGLWCAVLNVLTVNHALNHYDSGQAVLFL